MLSSRSKSCPFKATPAPLVSLSLCGSNLTRITDAVTLPLHSPPELQCHQPLPGPPDTSLYRVVPGVADTSLSCAALWVLRPRTREQPLPLFKPSACGDAQVILWGDQHSPARSQSAISPKPQVGSSGCGSPVFARRLARSLPQWRVGSTRQHRGRYAALCPALGLVPVVRPLVQSPHQPSLVGSRPE